MRPYPFFICLGLALAIIACQASPTNEPEELAEEATAQTSAAPTTSPLDSVNRTPERAPSDNHINLPANLKMVAKAQGDLNKDGLNEQVFVVEPQTTDQETGAAPARRLQIYHQVAENAWLLWQDIPGGVLPADAGGILGDPFQEVKVERGALVIDHFGGSRIRWHYTHRFRWQNEQWQLIGATIVYGAPCDYWHTYDYNLSTDKVVGKWETENCDTEETTEESFTFRHRIQPLPNLVGFVPGETEVRVPDRDETVYF
ncbi:MAG: hypothetical protein AAFY48_21530 [Bacteroidota bacterium]